MKINEIGMPKGANRKTKRRGRGSGSGHGKNACRGRKGALHRSGRTTRPGFEGGQMSLLRRLPKRGFNSKFGKDFDVVNLESLNRFHANSIVGPAELKAAGLIGSTYGTIKILGTGKLTKILTFKVHKVSESAKKAIEASGSKIEYIKE